MLVAKRLTNESMQDGTTRVVVPNAPFLNPATKDLPRINLWAKYVIEGTDEHKESLALISDEDRRKYIDMVEDEEDNSDVVNDETTGADKDETTDETTTTDDKDSEDEAPTDDKAVENTTPMYTEEDLNAMDIDVIKDILKENNISFGGNSGKNTLIKKVLAEVK